MYRYTYNIRKRDEAESWNVVVFAKSERSAWTRLVEDYDELVEVHLLGETEVDLVVL